MKLHKNFSEDTGFLKQHVQTIIMGEPGGPQIAVVPAYQGRTMTSSTGRSSDSTSFGWINYDLIQSGTVDPQMNLFGGEDRFWLSPEGGQYSIFFDQGEPLEFEKWRVPEVIDTEPFQLVGRTDRTVDFRGNGVVRNYSGFQFELQFDRKVKLLTPKEVCEVVGLELPTGLHVVAHESRNRLTNNGDKPWLPESGLLGIWVLCMNKPTAGATVIVPFKPGPVQHLGPIVNSDYFGVLDESRLKVDQQKSLIYFLGDGRLRSKLGLTYQRVVPTLGSWDGNALTITQFNLPESIEHGYTNNLWEIQDNPYAGDVINSYNDGPNETGGVLGPFYELETLSPALALSPQESYTHVHRTIHIEGQPELLSDLAVRVFGVGLDEIEQQFPT